MAGKPATLRIDILTDASDAQKGIDKLGREAQGAKGEFDDLGQAIYNAMAHNGAQISDSAESMEKFGGAAGDAASGISAVGGALQATGVADFTAQIAVASAVLDGLEGATRLYTVATQAMGQWQKVTAAATKVWAGTQWLLNAAMSANPIGLMIVAIVALIAIIAVLWVKSETFRTIVLSVWHAIAAAGIAVWDALKAAGLAVFKFLGAAIGLWVSLVRGYLNGVKLVALAVWTAIRTAAVFVWSAIVAYIRFARDMIVGIVQGVASVAAAIFGWLRDRVSDTVRGWIIIFNFVKDAILGVVRWLRDRVSDSIHGWVIIFESVKDTILSTIRNLRDIAGNILEQITKPIDAVKEAFDRVIDAIRSVIDWIGRIHIPDAVKGILGKIGLNSSAASFAPAIGPRVGLLGNVPVAAMAASVPSMPVVMVSVNIDGTQLDARVDARIQASNNALARRITGRAKVLR